MECTTIYGVLQKVAVDHRVSVEEVIKEISICIDVAMETAKQENDQRAFEMWNSIPCTGDKPTPEELLSFLVEKIKEDRCRSSCDMQII